MSIKHFVDINGNYLGLFIDGATPTVNAQEVEPRPDANHIWQNGWVYDEETHWANIRVVRDAYLEETDLKAALPDHPQLQAVLDYRKALRDLPESFASPDEVVWPDNPLDV